MQNGTKQKVRLITWWEGENYGSVLQAYSLYRVLERHNCEVRLLPQFQTVFNLKTFKDTIFKTIGIRRFWKPSKRKTSERTKLFSHFVRKVFKRQIIATKWQYKKMLKETDVFITGSDQLWNSYDHFIPFLFLDFAKEKRKISYATSIGTNDFPDKYKHTIREYLNDYSHIAVREYSAKKAIERLTGRNDIVQVLDPTLLIEKQEWELFAQETSFTLPEKYIACYLLKKDNDYIKQVQDIARKTGIKNIVIIPSAENPDFCIPEALVYRKVCVKEFVKIISNAALICTDSFHGTVFSINLQKQFVLFKRFDDNDTMSQNSRLYDLLNSMNIENRFYEKDNDCLAYPIDYEKVCPTLKKQREASEIYLEKALGYAGQ